MELVRKPFQGITNIVRFNWHFYLIAAIFISTLILCSPFFPIPIKNFIFSTAIMASGFIVLSLSASYYIYDISDLYQLKWLQNLDHQKIVNIHAGFDETSAILMGRFKNSEITICDFYNPKTHTEVSVKRARKAYPPHKNTITVNTANLPFLDHSFHTALVIFSAHEIRDTKERETFFKELNRIVKPDGQIVVTEHLRDWKNFLVYTVGFFHFYSKSSWERIFKHANLSVKNEIKTTPFITTFILQKDGNTL